jgi:hypothetical protein
MLMPGTQTQSAMRSKSCAAGNSNDDWGVGQFGFQEDDFTTLWGVHANAERSD